MITIQTAVEEIINESPFLESALADGFINTSALARHINPDLETKLFKDIHKGAVIVALNRLKNRLKRQQDNKKLLLKNFGDIMVRSNLEEITFINSPYLLDKQRKMLEEISNERNVFLTLTQSLYQTTLIFSSVLAEKIKKIFSDEKILSNQSKLSAITLVLSENTVKTPGVYYLILKTLAWYEINIIEVVSSFTELTLIFENSDVDQAFSVLKKLSPEI